MMRYLFLTVLLAFLLAMGMPFMAIAGPPDAKPMPSQAEHGLNKAMGNSDGVVGFDKVADELKLTITPKGEVGPPDDVGNPGNPLGEGLSMPGAAEAGLLDNPSGVIDFPGTGTDNVLTVSPMGDVGGPGDTGNPGYVPDNHPGRP